jgi:DNA-directed RNA polymerase subunit RPC12/RpoP
MVKVTYTPANRPWRAEYDCYKCSSHLVAGPEDLKYNRIKRNCMVTCPVCGAKTAAPNPPPAPWMQ